MKFSYIFGSFLLAALLNCSKGDSEGNVTTTQLEIHTDLQDHKCPTWFVPSGNNSHRCECGSVQWTKCNQTSKQVWLYIDVCMTYDNVTKTTLVAHCPFSDLERPSIRHAYHDNSFALLPKETSELNEFMCGKMNRDGRLCHKCKPGFGPAVLSYEGKCLKCFSTSYGWLLYLLLACLPTTLLLPIAIIFQVRIASASMNAFVLYIPFYYYDTVAFPQKILGLTGISRPFILAFVVFGGFLNLDFLRYIIPLFCISDRLTNLHVLTLEYVVALCPLFLTALTYVVIQLHARDCRVLVYLWRPFSVCFAPLVRRYQWNPAESLVHVFVTFLVLSYSKFLFVSFNLLSYIHVYNSTGALVGRVLYYDASVLFFSREHLPFAFLAIFVILTFNILPLLVVVLYPTRVFQKCLNCCRIRWHAVHAFADAFNGCYKDGTNGTWDYRYFAGFYLLARILYFFNGMVDDDKTEPFKKIIAIALLLFALCRPYKKHLFNIVDSIFLLIATLYVIYRDYSDILLAALLLLYFIMYILSKILMKLQCQCFLKLKSFVDQLTDEQKVHLQTNREDGQNSDLPDRLANPEGYRLLSESATQRGGQNTCDNTHPVATYGIV